MNTRRGRNSRNADGDSLLATASGDERRGRRGVEGGQGETSETSEYDEQKQRRVWSADVYCGRDSRQKRPGRCRRARLEQVLKYLVQLLRALARRRRLLGRRPLLVDALLALRRRLLAERLAPLLSALLPGGSLLGSFDVDASMFDLGEIGGLIALGLGEMTAEEGGLRRGFEGCAGQSAIEVADSLDALNHAPTCSLSMAHLKRGRYFIVQMSS